MIYIPPIPELSVFGVVDAGVPNRERICLRPSENVDLAHFGILLAIRNITTGIMTPANDHFFWFGELSVSAPAWIIVLTGSGEFKSTTEKGFPVHIFYWNKKHTLFNVPIAGAEVVPVLFRLGAIHMVPVLPTSNQVRQISEQ